MTTLNVHQVKCLELKEVRTFGRCFGRDIVIETIDGQRIEVALFGSPGADRQQLMLEHEKTEELAGAS